MRKLRRTFGVLVGVLSGLAGILAPFDVGVSAQEGGDKRWIVIYHQQGRLPPGVDDDVAAAGGRIVARVPEIGVLGAASRRPDFATAMANDPLVKYVVEDRIFQMLPPRQPVTTLTTDMVSALGDGPVEAPGGDAQNGFDPFYTPFQWDKKRMRASNQGSYAVQQGRPEVVVAVLDTGAEMIPAPHPDISPNLDVARSRAFFPDVGPNGDPNPAAWDDKHGHGSWALSAIAAPINGIGMSGVAPRVRLVALKVLSDEGSGSLLHVARALVYAGRNKFDVANMSFGAYLERSNPDTHVLLELLRSGITYARSNGVTLIAALGNDGIDLSDGSVMRSYILVPAEIGGVIGVSATGYFNLKASYSNYGSAVTDVAAPGGDFGVQVRPGDPGLGGVLGAWAADSITPAKGLYVFASGTSMAAPNAAGVAALIISQYGDFTPDNSTKAHMSPTAVEAILQKTANNQACPQPSLVTYYLSSPPFPPNTPVPDLEPQQCTGGGGHTNFYGKGIADALKAVTR